MNQQTKGAVLSDRYVPDSATVLGDMAGVVGAVGSRSANFASSMSLADMLNVGVTAIAAKRGDHLMGMPATAAGVAIKSDPSNFLSAAALSGGWALTGVVGLSIYIIGNVYVTLHQRLLAHHDVVVSLYKCYGMLLRIENFLKAAEIYCKTYDFQIDSLEIQDDLVNVFRVLDEITTQDDIKKVYANVQQGITFTLDSAGPNNDQVIASPTQGHPFKSFFSNRGRAILNSTGAVLHKLTTNVTKWCNRFNAVMIEINMHFTLLTSEFFMLANIYQMRSPTQKNEDFANRMMNDAVINDKQNPLWCIKLQIMLAPFLRVRNILFSCALSTNTELCRLTANREMQAIDRTNGFNGKALWAYLKRLVRLYTIDEAKTINVGLFLDILRNAVENVEANCYFKDLHQTDHIRSTVNELSTLLVHQNISKDHALFMKVINLLDEIYKIVLACGRANQQGFINLESNQFHSDHFTASRMHYKERVSTNLELVAANQLRPFVYANDAETFSNIDEIANFVTGKCTTISLLPPTVNEHAYDVRAHSTESDHAIVVRLRNMIRPTITTDAAAADDAAALADAVSASVIPGLTEVQKAYNTLYKFVMKFDPSSTRLANIVEWRGRWLAGCILLIERALTGAVLLSKPDIDTICVKCKILINMIKNHAPKQSLNQMPFLFENTTMVIIIRKITTLSESVRVSAAAAAAAPMQLSGLALPQPPQPQQPQHQQPQPTELSRSAKALNTLNAIGSVLSAPFKWKSKTSAVELTDRLLNKPESSGSGTGAGGGRNKLRKTTRRFNRKCNRTKRLCARSRLSLRIRRRIRRSHTRRR